MKGFTLIELLTVIIVLAIIGVIAVQGVSTALKKSKESSYETQINNIITASKNWTLENVEKLPETLGESFELSLDELKKSGNLANQDIIDSRNNTKMNGCVVIKCATNCKQYNYEYITQCTK